MLNETEVDLNITHHLPQIINKSSEEMDDLLRRIRGAKLTPEDQELIQSCI
jgi:hypothetical protein